MNPSQVVDVVWHHISGGDDNLMSSMMASSVREVVLDTHIIALTAYEVASATCSPSAEESHRASTSWCHTPVVARTLTDRCAEPIHVLNFTYILINVALRNFSS